MEADRMMKKRILILVTLLICLAALPALAEDVCKFDRTVTTLFEGDTLQTVLILEGAPAGGTVTYSSSATHNGVVDENGLVTGVSKGSTTITATVKTEKRTYKATIQLNVLRRVTDIAVAEDKLALFLPTSPEVAGLLAADLIHHPETGEVLDEAAMTRVLVLRLGANQSLQATCSPKDANDRTFVITSSDNTVVRVSGTTLQPKSAGECTITVASKQNPEVCQTYHALVIQPVTRLQITADAKSAYVGYTLPLYVTYTPENASIQAVTWYSSNTKVATVDENGVVTGVSKGSATIKATASDGSGRNTSYTVTIMQQPESISLKEDEISVSMGSYKTLSATVLPASANDKKVVWSSSDESVATVNQSGRVTPVAPGKCTVTCRSEDFPQVYTTARVTVLQPVTKIVFTQDEIALPVDSSVQVFWEVYPLTATNQSVTFSSNKPSIATVDEYGMITGHKRGECYITVKAADGSGRQDSIKVSVEQPVEGVYMENDTLMVGVNESATAYARLEPADASNTRMTWTVEDDSIAQVRGNTNRATVTGLRWGTTTITGTTQDGGYTTTATVKVGNFDKALEITDFYLNQNVIKIMVRNISNMNITRFYFTISCYDKEGQPLPCTEDGSNTFDGYYRYNTLYEGDYTEHGRFTFSDFVQPEEMIAKVTMQITGYSTDEGYSRDIRESRQVVVEFLTTSYVGEVIEPEPDDNIDSDDDVFIRPKQ